MSGLNKDEILQNIFSSGNWEEPRNNELIQNIKDRYFEELNNYKYVNSINYLKENVKCGCLVRYFTHEGEIRYGGILLKKILVKKNGIDDAMLLLKNAQGQTWKFHFNNYLVFFNKNNKNEKMRDIFISFLPDSAQEDYKI